MCNLLTQRLKALIFQVNFHLAIHLCCDELKRFFHEFFASQSDFVD